MIIFCHNWYNYKLKLKLIESFERFKARECYRQSWRRSCYLYILYIKSWSCFLLNNIQHLFSLYDISWNMMLIRAGRWHRKAFCISRDPPLCAGVNFDLPSLWLSPATLEDAHFSTGIHIKAKWNTQSRRILFIHRALYFNLLSTD